MSIWVLVPIFFVLTICVIVIIYAICMGCSECKSRKSNRTGKPIRHNSTYSNNDIPDFQKDDANFEHRNNTHHDDTESICLNDDEHNISVVTDGHHTLASGVALDAVSGITEVTSFGGISSSHTGGGDHGWSSSHTSGGDHGWNSSHHSTSGGISHDSGGGNNFDVTSNDAGGGSTDY